MSTATSTPLSTSPSTTAPTGPPSPTNDADDTPLATPTDADTDASVKREFDELFVQQETTEVLLHSCFPFRLKSGRRLASEAADRGWESGVG